MPGFLSGSTALTVFKVDAPGAITAEKLKQYAFQPIDELPEPKGWGWTNIDDMFDTEWAGSVPEKGTFICFALRIDTRKVPPAILKKHLTEAFREEEERLRQEGKTTLSRSRKRELKEQYSAKLLSQTEPVPSAVDVALDVTTGLLYVATTSSALLELLESSMEKSFEVKMERLSLAGLEKQDGLDEQRPVEQLMGKIYESSLNVSYEDAMYTVAEAGQATLAEEGGSEVTVRNAPDSANAGLEAGLSIRKLKVKILRDDEEELEWETTLDSDFNFSALKTPKVEKEDDNPDAALLTKLYLLSVAVGVLHTLFRQMWAGHSAQADEL